MDVDDLWYKSDGSPSARHGKGSRWQARWRNTAGKQRGKVFARKLDAERWLARVTADKSRGAYVDPAGGKTLLRDFTASWQRGLASGPTNRMKIATHLRVRILPELGDHVLAQLRPSVISAWQAGLRKQGLSDGYVRGIRATLSAILDAAVEDQLIASNPCRSRAARLGRAPERKVVPWTAARVAAVAGAIAPDLRALVICGAATGLRQGELFGLAAGDIDFLRRVIHVRRQVRLLHGVPVFALPKGGKTRDVPLPDLTGLALARHMELYPPVRAALPWETREGKPHAASLLFAERSGGKGAAWRRSRFDRQAWHPALKAAGTPWEARSGDGCHALRHFAASSWLAEGCAVNEVAAYLGHADATVTLRTYAHLMPNAPDRMRAASDRALRLFWPGDEDVPQADGKP